MLTAKQFSQQAKISYPLILEWLKIQQEPGAPQKLPGAAQVEIGDMRAWQIPVSLVARYLKEENRPKKGRPPKVRV